MIWVLFTSTFNICPKLRTADGKIRKRFLCLAIDRCSRFVQLDIYDAENAANAISFLKAAGKASLSASPMC